MAELNTIKFKYIFSKDYNPKYINGAYGGITGKGEIAVHFYLERPALPNSQTHNLTKDGKLSDNPEFEPADLMKSMIRFVDTGIVMDLRTAKDIAQWLDDKIKMLEKLASESK